MLTVCLQQNNQIIYDDASSDTFYAYPAEQSKDDEYQGYRVDLELTRRALRRLNKKS